MSKAITTATLNYSCPGSKTCAPAKKADGKKKSKVSIAVSWFAGLSLLGAFIYGHFFHKVDFTNSITLNLETEDVQMISDKEYQIVRAYDGEILQNHLVLGEESGYGGPMVTGTLIDEEGLIDKIILVEDRETHSYVQKLKNKGFFKQFDGRSVGDRLRIGEDIDAISGATISSVAITDAVRISTHDYGTRHFDLSYPADVQKWEFAEKDYLVILLFLFAGFSVLNGKKWLRYTSLFISMAFLGFYFNSALNVSQFGRVLMGYIPLLKSNVYWFVLVFGTIGFSFFLKKNVYCNAMCPFHAVEIILVKIGGMKIKFTPTVLKIAKHSAKFLLWLSLMLTFISQNPTVASYEPFAMVFGLEGEGVHWYLLPAVLIGVLFISDYFCRYFCPVGKGYWYVIKFRKWLDEKILLGRQRILTSMKS